MHHFNKLADLIERDRDVLLSQWRQHVRHLPSTKHLDTPTLNDHIPSLLNELVTALDTRSEQTIALHSVCASRLKRQTPGSSMINSAGVLN